MSALNRKSNDNPFSRQDESRNTPIISYWMLYYSTSLLCSMCLRFIMSAKSRLFLQHHDMCDLFVPNHQYKCVFPSSSTNHLHPLPNNWRPTRELSVTLSRVVVCSAVSVYLEMLLIGVGLFRNADRFLRLVRVFGLSPRSWVHIQPWLKFTDFDETLSRQP